MSAISIRMVMAASKLLGTYAINYAAAIASSSRLAFTPATAANRRTAMWDVWVMPSGKNAGSDQAIWFQNDTGTGGQVELSIRADGTFRFYGHNSSASATLWHLQTSRVLRDYGSFCHIHCEVDCTNTTASIWINGELVTDLGTNTQPTNTDGVLGGAFPIGVGARNDGVIPFDGYIAAVRYYNGQVNGGPTDFGETDTTTGNWKAKKPATAFGTNDHDHEYLFGTLGSEGLDTSGNSNNGTKTGTVTQVTSTPTNTAATMNPLVPTSCTYTEGNLRVIGTLSASHRLTKSTLALPFDKVYFEAHANVTNYTAWYIGFANNSTLTCGSTGEIGDASGAWGYYGGLNSWRANGSARTVATNLNQPASASDYACIALDLSDDIGGTGYAWIGTHSGGAITWETGDPVAGTSPLFTFAITEELFVTARGNDEPTVTMDGNWNHTDTLTGFKALTTDNLPTQTGSIYDHFGTLLWTGDSTSNRAITGLNFQPGAFIAKLRNTVGGWNWHFDPSNVTRVLRSNNTAAETTDTDMVSFDVGGVTVSDISTNNTLNDTTNGAVVGYGLYLPSSETNTSGTISVAWNYNATAGWAIGEYTGNGTAGATLGLPTINGTAPKMGIIKSRGNAYNWAVYHSDLASAAYHLRLNLTDAQANTYNYFNSTDPTSSLFTLGDDNGVNQGSDTYVILCFWETDFCKIGRYTGNGSTDGSFINMGALPEWLLTKRTDSASDFVMWDGARNPNNIVNLELFANDSLAEASGDDLDFVSNGVKIRRNAINFNASGGTYIYLAFVQPNGPTENPGR